MKRPVQLNFTIVRNGNKKYFQIKFRGITLNLNKFNAALIVYKETSGSVSAKEHVTISYHGNHPKSQVVDIELYYHMGREDDYYFITKINSGPETQNKWLEANSFEEGDSIEFTFLKNRNKAEMIIYNALWNYEFVIDKNYRDLLVNEHLDKTRHSTSSLKYYLAFHFLLPKESPCGPKGTLTLKPWEPKNTIRQEL